MTIFRATALLVLLLLRAFAAPAQVAPRIEVEAPPALAGTAAPEPLLVVRRLVDRLGMQDHLDDAGPELRGVELPAHPVDHVERGEGAGVQPGAAVAPAGLPGGARRAGCSCSKPTPSRA